MGSSLGLLIIPAFPSSDAPDPCLLSPVITEKSQRVLEHPS